MDKDISLRTIEFIRTHFPLARKQSINETTPLLETGIIDSLGILDLVAFIEDAFAVHVDDDDLTPEHFASVQTISDMVQGKARRA